MADKVTRMQVILSAVDHMSSKVQKAVMRSKASLKALEDSKSYKGFQEAGDQALTAGAVITGALAMTVLSAEAAATANARLEQVFRSMGETNNQAAEAAARYADALELQTGVDGDLIMLSQAKLATFKEVSNESARMAGIFDRATAATVDLAAAGFGDAASNAVQLGKALNDPIKGISAMTRSGITFTAEEQKKIKALTESGRILEAQNMILAAVEKQVGGVSGATANDTDKMVVAFGQMTEAIGVVLLPVVAQLTEWMRRMVDPFREFTERNPGVIKAIAATGAALLAFGVIAKVTTAVVTIMNAVLAINPIVLITMAVIAGIAAVAALVVYFEEVVNWFKELNTWAKIALSPLLAVLAVPLGLIYLIKKVIANWSTIKGFFSDLWESVKRIFNSWLDWVVGFHVGLYDAGANLVNSIWNGMKSKFDAMLGWFEEKIQVMRDYLPFSPAKIGPLKDIHKLKLVETIQQSIKPAGLAQSMEQTAAVARSSFLGGLSSPAAAPSFSGGAMAAGGGITVSYSPTINVGAGADSSVVQQVTQVMAAQKEEIKRIIQEIARDRNRRAM